MRAFQGACGREGYRVLGLSVQYIKAEGRKAAYVGPVIRVRHRGSVCCCLGRRLEHSRCETEHPYELLNQLTSMPAPSRK